MNKFDKAYIIGRILHKWDGFTDFNTADIMRMCWQPKELEWWFELIMYAYSIESGGKAITDWKKNNENI